MFVRTEQFKQETVKMAIRKELPATTSEETDGVQACHSLAKLEEKMDALEEYLLRYPERECPVQKILITFPDELCGLVEPKEFFVSMHDLVVDLIPFGCMIGSIQSYNRDITIYVDGRPVVYHMYMEVYILAPQDVDSSFDVDLERTITDRIGEIIEQAYTDYFRKVVFEYVELWWGLNQEKILSLLLESLLKSNPERLFPIMDAWLESRGIGLHLFRQRPEPYDDLEP